MCCSFEINPKASCKAKGREPQHLLVFFLEHTEMDKSVTPEAHKLFYTEHVPG
jgi:hypothetical protein